MEGASDPGVQSGEEARRTAVTLLKEASVSESFAVGLNVFKNIVRRGAVSVAESHRPRQAYADLS